MQKYNRPSVRAAGGPPHTLTPIWYHVGHTYQQQLLLYIQPYKLNLRAKSEEVCTDGQFLRLSAKRGAKAAANIMRVQALRGARFLWVCIFQGFSRVMTQPAGVGSGGVHKSRVGSGRVNMVSNTMGRTRSGQEVMKAHGSGQVMTRDMTREKWVTRGSGQHEPQVCFLLTRGSDPRIRLADPHFSLSYSKAYLVLILKNNKTSPNTYTHARIHPYPLQPGHISRVDPRAAPASRIRGSR